MSKKIADIEGIGPKYAAKLEKAGVRSVAGLLKLCCDKKGRKAVAEQSGIDASHLLKWANMADLYRIKGVGSEYSELLEASGVDTVKELRNRKPENLHAKMVEVNAKKKLVRQLPSATQVADFVNQAKSLDPVITH
jgi:predicted flap endonuclease-1-like 5' DNA nuclease